MASLRGPKKQDPLQESVGVYEATLERLIAARRADTEIEELELSLFGALRTVVSYIQPKLFYLYGVYLVQPANQLNANQKRMVNSRWNELMTTNLMVPTKKVLDVKFSPRNEGIAAGGHGLSVWWDQRNVQRIQLEETLIVDAGLDTNMQYGMVIGLMSEVVSIDFVHDVQDQLAKLGDDVREGKRI